MEFATADLCDAHGDAVVVFPPGLLAFGGRRRFAGPVACVHAPEDNSFVKAALAEPGAGHVLVVDGEASSRRALLGGNLATLAARNGWSGVVVWGCVRDVLELALADVGVLALGTCPRRSEKRDRGRRDTALQLDGVVVHPGDWLYADEDGVILAPRALHDAVG